MSYTLNFDDEITQIVVKARKAVDREQASRALAEALEEYDVDDLRELAVLAEALAEAIDEATQAGADWRDAEGRDDKAEAREEFLGALDGIFGPFDALEGE